MEERLLSARERAVWFIAIVVVSAVLVATRFESSDPDSALYASLSEKLSAQPVSRWIAPEWWGLWPEAQQTGYFLEHPAGLFFIPAALGRLGVPPLQAAYVFGAASSVAALLLGAWLVMRVASRPAARAALVLLQIMPLAFIFRLRDNHEYPMLVCLLAGLAGLEAAGRTWLAVPVVACAFAAALLVKGVFVVLILLAAVLWIAINPTDQTRPRQIIAFSAGLAAMAIAAVLYDAAYMRATGQSFWQAYWHRQLEPMSIASPLGQAWMFVQHVAFYLVRLLYHPAPWSLVLVWAAWRRDRLPPARRSERRGLAFVLTFAGVSLILLSVASRFAERYAFSASFMIGAAGAAIACRSLPRLRQALVKTDSTVPMAAPLLWLALVLLRLTLAPWLPRT